MHKKNNQIKRIDQKRRLAICITYREIGVSPIAGLFLLVFFYESKEVYMQTHGYLMINDQKILVLARNKRYGRAFKKRFAGTDGTFFEDESCFLSKNKEIFDRLLLGKVINI